MRLNSNHNEKKGYSCYAGFFWLDEVLVVGCFVFWFFFFEGCVCIF